MQEALRERDVELDEKDREINDLKDQLSEISDQVKVLAGQVDEERAKARDLSKRTKALHYFPRWC